MDKRSTLTRAVAGDMNGLATMSTWTHADLVAAAGSRSLVVTADAVAKVLTSYLRRTCSAEDTRHWASLMRRGHLDHVEALPIHPIEIAYELEHEEAIADAIFRMDELGDSVDGEIGRDEGRALLRALSRVTPDASADGHS